MGGPELDLDRDVAVAPTALLARRSFLGLGLAAFAGATLFGIDEAEAALRAPPRILSLHNVNTGEKARIEYWSKGRYQREGARKVAQFMRDYRSGETRAMDPKLLDLLHNLGRKLGHKGPIHIISGYRSPATNRMLRARDSEGVARVSYHTQGKALDIRVPGVPLSKVWRAARELKAGGVGYYPESDFVHIDVGPVRTWQT